MSADFVFSYCFSSGTDVLHRGRHIDHEVGWSERYLLLALDAIRRRAALHVDVAGLQLRDPVARRHRLQVDFEIRHLELGLDRIDDLHAKVHRVADRLLLVVEVRERDRRLAMADRYRAGLLDLLQRAGEVLRLHRESDGGGGEGQASLVDRTHRKSPMDGPRWPQ